ncbi:hypothetical protein E2C01_071936 [Portunus trituberculatus]|uniref:Uncharacterized protein n=1 Tax=Portunus trituberculatus TaxID=210409 RepID=A0A5B7I186_PORTR|nr:hypothetical protein [Portunus trituberculatus]
MQHLKYLFSTLQESPGGWRMKWVGAEEEVVLKSSFSPLFAVRRLHEATPRHCCHPNRTFTLNAIAELLSQSLSSQLVLLSVNSLNALSSK